ncbi:hypothetical protein M5C72_08595 [Companilactobacillus allii]|uniref:Uncharacterized protein n=1 Tax=Companilactobacillus allii TaxID=1847728 RepID=A0A1P8Q5K5_9LACO|nr:hypothetical protein [Companilactobacillus allii]APX73137.1 hypothetical protein BTM29_11495 [Companilactobacillus allii]USQ67941.1 hypothetical protein M5C72_08595 [Companilactobacillus allii]
MNLDDVIEAAIEYGRSQAMLDFMPDESGLDIQRYLNKSRELSNVKKAYMNGDEYNGNNI